MRFKFVGPDGPRQYMNPPLLAEPGETYELDKVPDDGRWEKPEKGKPKSAVTNEEDE